MLGEIVPRGKVVKEYVETWLGAAMPSWLESTAGTVSYGAPATSSGYIRVTSGSSNGNTAILRTVATYGPTHYREIAFTMEGLTFDAAVGANVDIELQIAGTNCGGQARTAYNEAGTPSYLEARNAGGNLRQDMDYNLVATDGIYSRNISIVVRPKDKEIYLLEGDQVMSYLDATSTWSDLNALRAQLVLTNRNAASHYFTVSQTKLTLVAN
jgi:hypothetical protein